MTPLAFSLLTPHRAEAIPSGSTAPSPSPSPAAAVTTGAARAEGGLFGLLSEPSEGGGDLGVVLCNPLGFEALSAHRTYRHLAERLAAAGIPALRFDYPGTGDSAGRPEDGGGLRAWVDGIDAAISELRARTGVQRIALFGVRLGATLATLAAREQGGVDALVLWAPIVSGRLHARELRVFSAAQKVPRRANGDLEVGGLLLPAATMKELAAVDLGASGVSARRVLVLPRSEEGGEETRWVEQLRAAAAAAAAAGSRGQDVELAAESGYAGMMRDDPYQVVVPHAALDRIVAWIGRAAPGDPGPRRHSGVFASVSRRQPPAIAVGGDVPLTETALRFGEGQRLFGIVTPPPASRPGRTRPDRRDRPGVILLNVGADHHVGPHRMNVDLARELAALGYLAFRFDAAGLGDSQAEPGKDENRIYTKDAVADVRSAMDLLGERHGARRFVLVGLCSGAFTAFHTTAADPRVAGQVLISTFAFEWKEGDPVAPTGRAAYASTRSYLRMLLERGVWARAIRGDVNLRGIAGVLLERAKTRVDAALPAIAAAPALLRGLRQPRNEVERAFVAMCERGVESLLVSAFNDGGLDTIGRYLGTDARRMRRHRRFALEVVEDADHTFTSIAAQRTLYGIVTRYMRAHFP